MDQTAEHEAVTDRTFARMPKVWIGDDCGYEEPEITLERGDAYIYESSDQFPVIRRPIGFIWTKPRIRIKAWTRPIL